MVYVADVNRRTRRAFDAIGVAQLADDSVVMTSHF